MFPFAIQSDTIANRVLDIVTPISGRTFGCWRVFHVTTSLQNLYTERRQCTACGKKTQLETHPNYLPQVTVRVYPYDLYGNVPAAVFPLPHIRKPTPIQRVAGPVIGDRDLQGTRKERVAATHPVQ